jgi:DNA-binding MarR family transcriptional regulator
MRSIRAGIKSSFPPLLHLSFVLQQSAEENLLREVGIGLSSVRIMSALSLSTAKSQRQVAIELRQTEANVSRQLQSMKKQGLVSIAKNKKDSRQRDVSLTSNGAKKYQSALKVLKKQQDQFLRILNASEASAFETAAQKLS